MLESIRNIDQAISLRTDDLSEPLDGYYRLAGDLEQTGQDKYVSRAAFIRHQCDNQEEQEIFDKHREDWGIPNFDENLVSINDFKRGFLYTFRDHTTSWGDNQLAKEWFLTSLESRFVRRYEFWTWDNECDECIEVIKGSYKEILLSLLKKGDYEVLISPIFSRADLDDFIRSFSPDNGDFTVEEIIENYIQQNINYKE